MSHFTLVPKTSAYYCMSEQRVFYLHRFLPFFLFAPSLFLSSSFRHSPSRQFTCLINYLSLQGRFSPSNRPSSQITHSTHNGVCSYLLSTERPGTHICSPIPQTINNSLLAFKSHFSDKVLTIKSNKLCRGLKGTP